MHLPRTQRFWLDAVGLVVATGLFYTTYHVGSPLRDLIVGVATSFVFASMLDILVAIQDRILDRSRVVFFGSELIRGETVLVYPDFVMHDEVRVTLEKHNQQMLFQRPESRFRELTVHRIDIPRTVAANDIQSLLYVSQIFEANRACPRTIMVDSRVVDNCALSFISFGLSSNDCTHLYMNEHADPMFTIVEDGLGSEFIRLRNGKEYKSTGLKQFGLILRYTPNPSDFPQRRWLLVAGLGPVGTTATGWYLAQHWRNLSRSVPRDRNFVAVVSTGVYTDRAPHLEEVLIDEPGDTSP